jgi:hypothetical protein
VSYFTVSGDPIQGVVIGALGLMMLRGEGGSDSLNLKTFSHIYDISVEIKHTKMVFVTRCRLEWGEGEQK